MHSSSSGTPGAEQRIAHATRRLQVGLGRLDRELFAAGQFGLLRSHVDVLASLADRPMRITELADLNALSQPRITVVVRELEERDLVERRRCEQDARAVSVTLTPAGEELLEQGRRRTAAHLLGRLEQCVDAPEQVVLAACDAITALIAAVDSETS